jgi:hypothetical protein
MTLSEILGELGRKGVTKWVVTQLATQTLVLSRHEVNRSSISIVQRDDS